MALPQKIDLKYSLTEIEKLSSECEIDKNTYLTLRDSIYPGAKHESIAMVVNYCKAKRLDPLMKPVHIIPMKVKEKINGRDEWIERDVLMPGIGTYRIDASRSGQYAGMDEPEFGDDVIENLGGKTLTYPKWCKIKVKKIINGNVFEFVAKEFWKENYKSKSYSDPQPNNMWATRPYGQLAKCAEAQALRKAFPDSVGQLPTFEEMEGINNFEIENKTVRKPKNTMIEVKAEEIIIDNNGDLEIKFSEYKHELEKCETIDELKIIFDKVKKIDFKDRQDLFKKLIDIKDAKKQEIHVKEFNQEYDNETGEIKE